MPKCSPSWLVSCVFAARIAAHGLPLGLLLACFCSSVVGQVDRQKYQDQEPLAEVAVQALTPPPSEAYADRNQVIMNQRAEEDPLSFYTRTQDGEWLIPTRVDRDDPWVRLLVLGPVRPTLIDVAVEINQQPFREAREQWIDKLLAEAKSTFLVRTGVASAEAAGITETEQETPAPIAEEEKEEAAEGTSDEIAASVSSTEDSTDEKQAANDAPEVDEADKDEADKDEANVPDVPMVAAQNRATRTLFQKLINYLAADQSTADREEVRWLLAEWTGGPTLLNLSPAFAWRRADTAPLWHALNRNGDSILSHEEIEQATQTLKRADINRDDNVNLSELRRLGNDQAAHERTKGHPLVVVIDEHTDWEALKKSLRSAYAKQADVKQGASQKQGEATADMPLLDRLESGERAISAADLANLLSITADVVYHVSFANEEAKMKLLAVGGTKEENVTGKSWRLTSSTKQAITVERQEAYLELTAAQGEIDPENVSGDMQQTQVAIGAVVDGYPLFRLLDQDNNRLLTLRERRDAVGFLTSLDRNQDGQIEGGEVPTAIRLAVTHGPKVHQHLANAVAAQRPHGDQTIAEAPAWFLGMDRNRDGDLSRREFQGSSAQFAKFDQDGDGLISRLESQGPQADKTKAADSKVDEPKAEEPIAEELEPNK